MLQKSIIFRLLILFDFDRGKATIRSISRPFVDLRVWSIELYTVRSRNKTSPTGPGITPFLSDLICTKLVARGVLIRQLNKGQKEQYQRLLLCRTHAEKIKPIFYLFINKSENFSKFDSNFSNTIKVMTPVKLEKAFSHSDKRNNWVSLFDFVTVRLYY